MLSFFSALRAGGGKPFDKLGPTGFNGAPIEVVTFISTSGITRLDYIGANSRYSSI